MSLLPGADTLGWNADPSVSIPLLRGAGRYIVTEPLTQAERDVIYEMWDFERYKRTFAVDIARSTTPCCVRWTPSRTARTTIAAAIQSARWSRRQADAGRITEIEVDQAVQSELNARNSWISTQEGLKSSLDSFKITIGLPTDALVELDPNDLVQLRERAKAYVEAARTNVHESETR